MKIKRLYFDLRMGQAVIFPIIAMVNFMIISYSLTTVDEFIPIHFYIPIVISLLLVALVVVGNTFRHRQQSTDFTLTYENNVELIKTLNAIMSGNQFDIQNRIKYHNDILMRHKQL